jgi:hypothetical protein
VQKTSVRCGPVEHQGKTDCACEKRLSFFAANPFRAVSVCELMTLGSHARMNACCSCLGLSRIIFSFPRFMVVGIPVQNT